MLIPKPRLTKRCQICGRNSDKSSYCQKCFRDSCYLVCSVLSSSMCDVRWGYIKPDRVYFEIEVGPYEKLFRLFKVIYCRRRPGKWIQFCKPFLSQVDTLEFSVNEVVEEPDKVCDILRARINKYPIKLNGLLKRYWNS